MVDLKKIDEFIIGSEPPKLIYADKEKVIFETTGGVYVYDMNDKALIRSFDTSSFASERYSNVLPNSFATEDGKHSLVDRREVPTFFHLMEGFPRTIVELIWHRNSSTSGLLGTVISIITTSIMRVRIHFLFVLNPVTFSGVTN